VLEICQSVQFCSVVTVMFEMTTDRLRDVMPFVFMSVLSVDHVQMLPAEIFFIGHTQSFS